MAKQQRWSPGVLGGPKVGIARLQKAEMKSSGNNKFSRLDTSEYGFMIFAF